MGPASLAELRKRVDYLRVDDVCYFAQVEYPNELLLQKQGLVDIPIVKEIMKKRHRREPAEPDANLALFETVDEYRIHREDYHREPEWINQLPQVVVNHIRHRYFAHNDEIDPLSMIGPLPYSGFGYHVLDYGLTDRISKTFGLDRLRFIKQLGFLHQPVIDADETLITTLDFNHTRYVHVNDVRAYGVLILFNNNASDRDRWVYTLCSLTHDTLTPAGGDSTKGIDKERFDEDLHYPELLERINWDLLPEFSDEDKAELPSIIMNEGVLGKVLDIADKGSYLPRDVAAYVGGGAFREPHFLIQDIVEKNPEVFSIWETVCIDGDDVFFTDLERLVQFLELRSLMFSQLYQNPSSRFWEQFVKTFVLEKLYKTGKVTAGDLLAWRDNDLQMRIAEEVGVDFLSHLTGMNRERREGFDTREEAEARKAQLQSLGRVVCILEESYTAKTGDHFLVETQNGLQSLATAEPAIAAHLKQLIKPDKMFNVFYLDVPLSELPETLRTWE